MGIFDGILGAVTSPIASIASSLIGGMFSSQGAQNANDTSLQVNQMNNAFNADQAAQNRAFQSGMVDQQMAYQTGATQNAQDFATGMSNTSYQRAVQDMAKAGLNPMLAYSQGGASTPTISGGSGASMSGSTASAAGFPSMQNVGAAGVEGARAAAGTQLASAQSATEKERAPLVRNQAASEAEAAKQAAWTSANFGHLLEIKIAQGELGIDLTKQEIDKVAAAISNLGKEGKLIDAREANVRISSELSRLEIPNAKALAAYWSSEWGKRSPYAQDAAKAIGTAVGAYRGVQSGMRDRYIRTGE